MIISLSRAIYLFIAFYYKICFNKILKKREIGRRRDSWFVSDIGRVENIMIFKMLFMKIKVLSLGFMKFSSRGIYIGHQL